MKYCIKCNQTKKQSEFTKCPSHSDGLSAWCRLCIHEYNQMYYAKNSKKIKACMRKYSRSNRLQKNEYAKKYRKYNPEKVALAVKSWKDKYPERYEKSKKIYRIDCMKRYRNDIQYNLKIKLRGRIQQALKRSCQSKSDKSIALLGCNYVQYKKHIESQFTVGMSWEKVLNGEIHIDHIIPLSSFDLSKKKDQMIAFNYINLQPLWAKDNLSKGAKILLFGKVG